jgi:uncharacterized protein YukE
MAIADGDQVKYNYGYMHDIAQQLRSKGDIAQALNEAAESNKMQMLSHFEGAAATTAAACLTTYRQAQTDIVEIIGRGAMNYTSGTDSMAATEQAQCTAFPGG